MNAYQVHCQTDTREKAEQNPVPGRTYSAVLADLKTDQNNMYKNQEPRAGNYIESEKASQSWCVKGDLSKDQSLQDQKRDAPRSAKAEL